VERNIVEILVILLRQYPEGDIKPEEFDPLTAELIGLGYSKHEIETALFWYYNRLEASGNAEIFSDQPDSNSFRVLHEVERTILTPGAYGYLVELRALGLITVLDMDHIIEKAIIVGGRKVTVDDIKSFVASFIMEQEAGLPFPERLIFLKTETNNIQ